MGSGNTLGSEIVLLGSSDVTLAVAEAVLDCGAPLKAIFTISDGFQVSYSRSKVRNTRSADIRGWGRKNGVCVLEFESNDQIRSFSLNNGTTLCLVAGWYHIVPRRVRETFSAGCFGFHASLLPELRGGAPLNWAILAGLGETGVTLFEMGDGADDGEVIGQLRFPIEKRTRIDELVFASLKACSQLTKLHIGRLLDGTAVRKAQVGHLSFGLQRRPEDGAIDWTKDADHIDCLIRAVGRPYQGAYSEFEDETIVIWRAEPLECEVKVYGVPGQVVVLPGVEFPWVVTGSGLLMITEVSTRNGDDRLSSLLRSNHKRFALHHR